MSEKKKASQKAGGHKAGGQKAGDHKAGGQKPRRQYGALPVRFSADGRPEILLVTTRSTGRWIIPKGWPMRRRSPAEAAAREAYEEAGIEGRIAGERPIGRYRYQKRLDGGALIPIEVSIYLLHVSRQLDAWPEQAERQTCWFDPGAAADKVAEPELARLLRELELTDPAPGTAARQEPSGPEPSGPKPSGPEPLRAHPAELGT